MAKQKCYQYDCYDFGGRVNLLPYDNKARDVNAAMGVMYTLNRTRRMFRHKNIPESIPERSFEFMLQKNGHCIIAEHNGEIVALTGNFSGIKDGYYFPKNYIVANPFFNINKTYELGKDCVLILNDSLFLGLLPLIARYQYMLAENELTMNTINVLSRAALVMACEDETGFKNAKEFIENLKKGELGIILTDNMMKEDSLKVQPGASTAAAVITNLIEQQQYLKASMYNELGLNANWNAKREAITSNESILNEDTLWPLVDDMLLCRQEGIEKVNEMFGTSWSVEFASSWGDGQEEREASLESLENIGEETKEEIENEESTDNVEEEEPEKEEKDDDRKEEP